MFLYLYINFINTKVVEGIGNPANYELLLSLCLATKRFRYKPNTTADIHAINPVIKVISISKIRRIIKQINNTIISQVPFLKFLALLNKLCFIFLHPLQENVYQSTFLLYPSNPSQRN